MGSASAGKRAREKGTVRRSARDSRESDKRTVSAESAVEGVVALVAVLLCIASDNNGALVGDVGTT